MESIPTTRSFETEGHARRMSLESGNSIHPMNPSSNGPSSNIPSDSILTGPNYSYIFGFEKDFDHVEVKEVYILLLSECLDIFRYIIYDLI